MDNFTRFSKVFERFMDRTLREVEESLEGAFSTPTPSPTPTESPSVDKQAKAVTIRLPVPGCAPEHVKVTLLQNIQFLQVQFQAPGDPEVVRSYRVSRSVSPQDISVVVKHGLATITITQNSTEPTRTSIPVS